MVFFGGWECFKNTVPEGSVAGGTIINKRQLLDKLLSLPEGARAGIIWTWRDGSRSHIIAYEKLGGQSLFIDPQKGTVGLDNLGDAHKKIGYSFFRTDNAELNEEFEWSEIITKAK